MAYIQDDEDKLKQGQSGLNTSGAVGSSITPQGVVGGNGTTGVDTTAPTSSGFVGLDKYLGANAGEGARLASAVTAGSNKDVDTFKDATTRTVEKAKTDYSAANGTAQAQGLTNGLVRDAAGTYKDAAGFLGANYTGPKADDYTAPLNTQAAALGTQLGNLKNGNTQQDILKQTYGATAPYNNYFSGLDQFLIGGQEGGRKTIDATAGRTAEVEGARNAAATGLAAGEADARAMLAANQKAVKDQAAAQRQSTITAAQARADALNSTLNVGNTGVVKAAIGHELSDKDRADLAALSQLAGLSQDSAWGNKEFNAGAAPTILTDEGAVTAPDGSTTFKPFGAASAIPGAVAKAGSDIAGATKKAGSDIAGAPKQSQAQPIVSNSSTAAPGVAQKVVDEVSKVIPTKAPALRRPKVGKFST